MLQITGIRSFEKNGEIVKFDGAFFDQNWRASSITDLFQNLQEYIDKIPAHERWNLFFTPCNCTANKREFKSTSVLWFDIDGIDTSQLDAYITAFCQVLELKREEIGIVFSGRGLHFYVGLNEPITDKKYFSQTKEHYKAVLDKLGRGFDLNGLSYKLDPSVYTPRQLMRLPGTINRKPERGADIECRIINAIILPQKFDICEHSGLPNVEQSEFIDTKSIAYAPNAEPILKGCEFLKYASEHADSITEPEWYAALSITARMDRGNEISHELSKGHPKYSPGETDKKIEQATASSGPRTCKNIQNLWGSCSTCSHWEKITSPISIKDPNEIVTEKTGFFHMVWNGKAGCLVRGKPDYEGLLKFFSRKHQFVSTEKVTWIWTGTHFVEYNDDKLKEFPQMHFKPECRNHMVFEFTELVWRSNICTPQEWAMNTERKINFKNGVLDLDTGDLLEHDPKYRFRHVLPYNYEPRAVAPNFQKFLNEVCESNEIHKNTLLEFGGYILSGDDCKYAKALMLEGAGANGKSTFIEVLKAVTGRQAYSTLSVKELENVDRRSSLDGVLYNITEETPNRFWDTPTFKNLISGGELQVRRLYKNPYNMRSRAKLVFSCNELPLSNDSTHGFFRRFIIVPFNQTFSHDLGNVDVQILAKLRLELPGIFNLLHAGWKQLEAQGHFSKIDKNDKELEEYKTLSNPIQAWIEECVEIFADDDEAMKVSAKDLYQSYKIYMEENGLLRQIVTSTMLGRKLRHLVPNFEKRKHSVKKEGEVFKAFKGLRVRIHNDKGF